MFQLKDYQRRCLDELAAYFRRTIELGRADTPFIEKTQRPYHQVRALPGLPYVCIRVPTGGGKTFMAAHAVGIAAREFLRQERCLVLWLAPTKQIVEQTLNALRDKRHPYREVLDKAFNGRVTVLKLEEALHLQPGTLQSDTTIIVSTMQAPRVGDTEGRKIYAEDNGQLMVHFSDLSDEKRKLLDKTESGEVACSLANVLKLHRPLVIVDEAHNVRTHLSFETLARFAPSSILEFTATPDQDPKGDPSNVLTHVSAAELKEEKMIKLPILLKCRPQWKEAVQEAVQKQADLERLAGEEEKTTGQYLRPVVLFQAQRNVEGEKNITYDVLKESLLADFNIPEDQIAVATGGVNDLEGVNVLDRGQAVRFVITVDKLREGWDCPFAYVLCTVSNLRSTTAVEQILGRILRMPYASKRGCEKLNQAYAFATQQGFVDAANALTEALVESGFERFEAKTMIQRETGPLDFGPLFEKPVSETVSTEPDTAALPAELRNKISTQKEGEIVRIKYSGPAITEEQARTLKAAFKKPEDKDAVERLCRRSRGEDASPAALGKKLAVPALAVRVGKQLELFEDQFREVPWRLSECDPALTEAEFALKTAPAQVAVVDSDEKGKIGYHFVEELERQLALIDMRGPQTEEELAVWLDRAIEHHDITQDEAGRFLRRMIGSLIQDRGFTLERLVANRFRLRDAARDKIQAHRAAAERQAYQQMLLPDAAAPVEVSPEVCFTFPLDQYPAVRIYEGPIDFGNHYYQRPGDMNDEEAACAAIIDSLPEVEYWVRNLERDGYAFWLQTATDKFYPDFVARLKDGRYMAVEYKGALWKDTADTKEKEAIGRLWEARSNGACLFRLVTKADMQTTLSKAAASPPPIPHSPC